MSKKVIKCQVLSRVCGYFQPVERWNDGKAQEFSDRKEYETQLSIDSLTKNKNLLVGAQHQKEELQTGLVVFGAERCHGCQELKSFLKLKEIPFTYKDAFVFKEEATKLMIEELPAVIINGRMYSNPSKEDVVKMIEREAIPEAPDDY